MALKTENTGLAFEHALCHVLNTPNTSNSKHKDEYSLEGRKIIDLLPPKLAILKFVGCDELIHTAGKNAVYDFTSLSGVFHLHAKSTKKGKGKVAPSRIGQPQPERFAEIMDWPFTDRAALKQMIVDNILDVLTTLFEATFDAPIVYYHEKDRTVKLVRKSAVHPVFELSRIGWTRTPEAWKNSVSMHYGDGEKNSILEIQFHGKKRTNMAIRWFFKPLLATFKDAFEVEQFSLGEAQTAAPAPCRKLRRARS